MKGKLKLVFVLILVGLCLLGTGCASALDFEEAAREPTVGFWHGWWHGCTAPISWIGSLFSKDIAVYAIYNNGGWYDFGYMLGIGAIGGLFSIHAKKE